MMSSLNHEESWLLLPWLANGRVAQPERARLEEHVDGCAECAQELALQRVLCRTLTEPDRVSYAPGPSFRKLMQRIDGRATALQRVPERRATRVRRFPSPTLSAWRPPGIAFAASFVGALALALATVTTYQWSHKEYATYTVTGPRTTGVLHIAFVRSLPVGEVPELLRAAGARVVEGPDASGIFGVAPAGIAAPNAESLSALGVRLRADARVRWVEPVASTAASATDQGPPRQDR